ncbi:preprotein translocase subunit YajC [Brevibacterium otitidis]|uniref:Preprotein translocase subunit YajC n=1 Tax=Brevibacterium otitidis TaxID=53364 RepID=A0ABV5X379_9MICO|nr:hypothetical protein GCM10023233_11210 [Brevibacterium otitidis]
MNSTLIFLVLGALMLFFMFSSRKKQKARQESLKNDLVPGAEVMTTFGVYGTVLTVAPEDHIVTIESGPGTVLRVHQQAIGHIEPASGVATDGLSSDDASSTDDDAAASDRYGDGSSADRYDDYSSDSSSEDRYDDYSSDDRYDSDVDDLRRDDRGDDFKA